MSVIFFSTKFTHLIILSQTRTDYRYTQLQHTVLNLIITTQYIVVNINMQKLYDDSALTADYPYLPAHLLNAKSISVFYYTQHLVERRARGSFSISCGCIFIHFSTFQIHCISPFSWKTHLFYVEYHTDHPAHDFSAFRYCARLI